MLTIKNIQKLEGTRMQVANSNWIVWSTEERKNDFIIRVRFDSGKLNTQTYPNWVLFKLLRYNEFESIKNEWRMYNDQNGDYITLTKGYLHDLKVFVGILGGQLVNICK